MLSPYGRIIIEATGCTPDETNDIEDVMRTQHPTMDHLTRPKILKLARQCKQVVDQLKSEDPDFFKAKHEDF